MFIRACFAKTAPFRDPPLRQHDWYFGPGTNGMSDDPHPMTGDPMFRAPGTDGKAINPLSECKFRPDPPCLGADSLFRIAVQGTSLEMWCVRRLHPLSFTNLRSSILEHFKIEE